MLTMCSSFTAVGVLFSLWCSKRTRSVFIFSLVIVMSFVRWSHIIFQYIQMNCDFTLTMKLPWFLLNLVSLCMTNIQAVKLWPVIWPCTMLLQQRKRRGVIDVILLWRHSSLLSTSRMKWPIFCLFVRIFGEFDPLNMVSHPSYPKKAHPCMIPSVMSHCASKPIHGSLQ